jgi:hypothetical protein
MCLYVRNPKDVASIMFRWRILLSVVLIVLWIAAPTLACLPNPTMTKSEMECCKKMAGDCHMGSHNHPCCEKTSTQPTLVATVQQPHVLHIVFTTVVLITGTLTVQAQDTEFHPLIFGLPPPASPNLNSVLKI